MATVELEGPTTGWVGSVGINERAELVVLQALDHEWSEALTLLLAAMLVEPAPSGRILGEQATFHDEDVLYDLAEFFVRRKPECRGERLRGMVAGGSRWVEVPDEPEEGPIL